ncbi:MAG: hypothetical protein K6C10_12845 [Prevotella sp.]|nr:hypothetical protein [Prevotella sp.]
MDEEDKNTTLIQGTGSNYKSKAVFINGQLCALAVYCCVRCKNFEKNNKGKLDQMVENIYFLLETNSNPAADFSEVGMELKCTPLKKSKQNEYLIKGRLTCNIILPSSTIRQREFLKTQIL